MDAAAINRFKQAAANSAATLLHDGMIVGLGSGTTATLAVAAIGRRVQEGLKIIGIPTWQKTADQARVLNIPLSTLENHPNIDVTIDGADEVETVTLNLTKGGGVNLLREKIVAVASSRMIVVVDETKVVGQLGQPLRRTSLSGAVRLEDNCEEVRENRAHPTLRTGSDGQIFRTDGGHYILDCALGPIQSPQSLQAELDSIVGVVEHGLFIRIAYQALVGGSQGVKILHREIAP